MRNCILKIVLLKLQIVLLLFTIFPFQNTYYISNYIKKIKTIYWNKYNLFKTREKRDK